MVVLASSICTKAGKPLLSRQFLPLPKTRIDALLAAFPKLVPPPNSSSQHTTLETNDVRYVYQPLDDLVLLLLTNKSSNILQDIDTLHLFARLVHDLCPARTLTDRDIADRAFELLGAFDEVVGLGYREPLGLPQIRGILEMESHEEKIQEIISRNKEAEAKEELKRRAKQLEMQRREMQRRAPASSGGFGGGASGYSPVPRYEAPAPAPTPAAVTSIPSKPAFKSGGLKLGKKTRGADILGAEADVASPLLGQTFGASNDAEISAPPTPSPPTKSTSGRGSLPEVEEEDVHLVVREALSATLSRDGGVESMEIKGDMNLLVKEPEVARCAVELAANATNIQFKQHPNVAKFAPGAANKIVRLKDPSKPFPVGHSLGVLKWRYSGKDESILPLSINAWPTPSNDGTVDVSLEYELTNETVVLYDVEIDVPLPAGSYPTVTSQAEGSNWEVDPGAHALRWKIPRASNEEGEREGSLNFVIAGDDAEALFPVSVRFIGQGSLLGVAVKKVGFASAGEGVSEDLPYSVDSILSVDDYSVV
ncbi:hypothetical protein BD626DRAFT_627172 [Schizophyllum amplum]|uniref:Coatomer subunit delta n=1 Tax=Schizophyllum amplum TaxID=97359 RepID=A0A550CPG3_9AGAR|nr:hypothetical protein BD626DRAFT_627172 [Auriculariopsis ampla]